MPIIINGGSRSAGGWWTKHLGNRDKNERVELIEIAGLDAATVADAFREMEAVSLGTKCTNYFYQANINPRIDESLTPAQWREAVDTLEKNLGLTGQPRFVVEHEKEGRTHRHIVWSRIDTERMIAIPDSLTAAVHERTSRELEIKFGLERGQSVLVPDREQERPERRPKKWEMFRGEQTGLDPRATGKELAALWQRSDSGQSFKAGLEAAGYILAQGDRRDFVVIDRAGDEHSLARRVGAKAAEVRARMSDIDRASLPEIEEAKTRQHIRAAAMQSRHRPDLAAEIEKHGRATEPEQPVTNAAAPQSQKSGRDAEQRPEQGTSAYRAPPENAPAARTTEPEATVAPTSEHDLSVEPLTPAEIRGIGGILGGILDGITKPFENLIHALADMFAPPPPLTKDQAEREAQSRDEAEQRSAEFREWVAEQERAREAIIEQSREQQHQREQDFYSRYGSPARDADRENDRDRGRERERER